MGFDFVERRNFFFTRYIDFGRAFITNQYDRVLRPLQPPCGTPLSCDHQRINLFHSFLWRRIVVKKLPKSTASWCLGSWAKCKRHNLTYLDFFKKLNYFLVMWKCFMIMNSLLIFKGKSSLVRELATKIIARNSKPV